MRLGLSLKMPPRRASALGTALVALGLCMTAPPRARACGVMTFDDDAMLAATFGMLEVPLWIAFAGIDIDAAADGRALSAGTATFEMLVPGMLSVAMGASLLDSSANEFAATALVAGTVFAVHGGYTLIDAAANEPVASGPSAQRPSPGHFKVAVNPDPRSPRASLSLTF